MQNYIEHTISIYILINQFYVYVWFGCIYVWIPHSAGKVRKCFGTQRNEVIEVVSHHVGTGN